MSQEDPTIQWRSEAIREIISYKPHWLVRWGMTLFLLILILILGAGWIIHYPTLVQASFRLTSVNAPKPVLSKVDGKIVRLLVANRERVKAGQALAFLESTANHAEVLSLYAYLEVMTGQILKDPQTVRVPSTFNQLGELQSSYELFIQSLRQYKALEKNGYIDQRRKLLEKERFDLQQLEASLARQLHIQEQDLQLAQEEYQLQQDLASQKVIAPLELKHEQSKLLAKKLPVQQTQAQLFENRTRQSVKQKELLELKQTMEEGESIFIQSLNTFRSALQLWKSRFIVEAPIPGRVVYASLLEENQIISSRQELFYIDAESKGYYGEVLIPQINFGKVKTGQKVLIKFTSYPYPEFGHVEGRIIYLSDIPTQQHAFLAKVSLPVGLITHYKKPITYKTGMNATAEIVTEDSNLLEVLLFHFRKSTLFH